jgi:hypothetical protein
MKITQIVQETTTSGSVATVDAPLFKQSRKGDNLLTGTKTKKKYANSISEGKMKELAMDLKSGKDGLTDEEFKKKYGKSKQEMRKSLESKPEQVKEAEISEQDLILVPGQGRRMKPGFISKAADRTDREVEMALGDLFQAAKNAKMTYDMLKDISEDEGIEGWVQEKIIKASDYLNTIREYLENKRLQHEGALGAVAGGVAGAYLGKSPSAAMTGANIGSALQDTFATEGKEELHAKLKAINHKLKMMRGGPVDRPNSMAFVEKRQALMKQKEEILAQLKQDVSEGTVDQLPTRGADYSKYDTGHLKMMLRPGILHRNEAKFKALIRKELQKREQQSQQDMAEGERTMSRVAKGYEKYGKQGMQALAKAGREGKDLDKIRDKYNKYDEGAKVDRMVKHIEKSEEKAGKSKEEAERIAWATANKRGMLNNRNKE